MNGRVLALVPKARHAGTVSPDAEALTRLANGDVAGLAGLYDRHAPALLRFAARAVGVHDAEDVVQATFLRVTKIASTYDARTESARPWLFGIAARLMQEQRRSLARLAKALLRIGAPQPQSHVDEGQRPDIARGLDRLTPAKRVVLVLAEVEGYTCEEIARMLEIPIGTVWTRLHHARAELRVFYEGSAR